jgi:hypothetical protein
MFNLLDVHSILDQFHSLSNLIVILKFHKIILAPLLGASSLVQNNLVHIPLIGFSTVVAWVLLLFICLLFVIVFSICMLFTSPAYDDVCLYVDVMN